MKITEITEGWGEHSNKSNHTMNKFKRKDDLPEGEFGQWAGRKAGEIKSAAGGMIKRQAADVKNTALAKMGSGKAAGRQKVQRVTGGVIKNFNEYLGQSGSKPTVGALKQYLTALGFQNPVMEVAKGARSGQSRTGFDPSKRGAQQPKAQAPAQQAPAQQAPATSGRKDTDILSRNDLFDIIGDNIQQALTTGALPPRLKKFLGQ